MFSRWCGGAGGERVPPAWLGWYIIVIKKTFRLVRKRKLKMTILFEIKCFSVFELFLHHAYHVFQVAEGEGYQMFLITLRDVMPRSKGRLQNKYKFGIALIKAWYFQNNLMRLLK